ncbi:acyltransferase [Mucilaginibacter agri]|uniref:Acyltransferase family protein n=1 Tax=Mucilaginibacter agri TaxID=2695265 RepID=A0A966DT75_9SPHI|nr:acyltransferase [Mucilaginibacter agri]NCD70360.1 acyltransferase family protein [Mucilaginibacter agri]
MPETPTMQQNLINEEPKKKKNYAFIDVIRCISMMSIVYEHSLGSYDFPTTSSKYWPYWLFVQAGKFGTVIFFLLSGFLIGDKFTDYTPGQYLKRRFGNTFGPWLFWSLIFVLCFAINTHVKDRMYHEHRLTLDAILDEIKQVYLYTNYWFIINFMVSITLLLIFKKYLYNIYYGAVLLSFTIFYCINIHYEWIDPIHTVAILGFVFFLWLGAQMRKHWHLVEIQIQKTPYYLLILFVLLTYGASMYEIAILKANNSIDPINTLRISNILFSLAVFALLLKIGNIKSIGYLKPRETTYGIYLIHYIIVVFAVPEILRPFHPEIQSQPALPFFAIKMLSFVMAYCITWLLVMGINKTPVRRLIGN